MLKKPSIPFLAFLQATGLVSYIVFFSTVINFVLPNFDKDTSEFYAPIIMLLIFIVSAVISASMVLGKAGMLFWEKRYRESFTLLGWTVGWGVLYIIMFLLILFLT